MGGRDIAQIRDVARECGMSAEQRRAFGREVEAMKPYGQPDFSYAELREIAAEFMSRSEGAGNGD
jgi:hypothetical protein